MQLFIPLGHEAQNVPLRREHADAGPEHRPGRRSLRGLRRPQHARGDARVGSQSTEVGATDSIYYRVVRLESTDSIVKTKESTPVD